ncbi:MAG: LLM class flavin-dependent oxidoreductase [Solirubrobacteraceae bacterium]
MTSYGALVFGRDLAQTREMAVAVEAAGLDVWTSEFYFRSATVPLAAIAAATSECRIGSSIMYGVGRSPVILAAEARDLDELSGGRLVLGLGNGTRRMMSDWHGADPSSPAVRMEELVVLLRALWRLDQGPVSHKGRFYEVHLRPTLEVPSVCREQIPIYIAGVNARMIEVAGRVCDGLIGHGLLSPAYLADVARPAIARGAALTGRDPGDVDLTTMVICSVDDDEATARRGAAASLAFYGSVRTYAPVLESMGFGSEGAAMREAFGRGDFAGLLAAVSDRMIDTLTIAGTPAQARAQLRRYDEIVDHVILQPPAGSEPSQLAAVAAIATTHDASEVLQ